MCTCDDVHTFFYHEKLRRVRKSYQCEECSSLIVAGEIYYYHVGHQVDGTGRADFYTFRECRICNLLRDWFTELLVRTDYCFPLGELRTCLSEAADARDLDTDSIFEKCRCREIDSVCAEKLAEWFPDWFENRYLGEGDADGGVLVRIDHPDQREFAFA